MGLNCIGLIELVIGPRETKHQEVSRFKFYKILK